VTQVDGAVGPVDRHAIYLDTPVLTAVRQVVPFFENGIFDAKRCTVYMRRRMIIQAQRAFMSLPKGIEFHQVKSAHVPADAGSVVFYPFNSQSNMNVVTQRQFHHVLTLHGESNKLASFRPAARLYDYICAAGPLALDRYLDHRIFTQADIDGGRLIQMGDSFVQRINWIKPAAEDDPEGVLFYCPTWEGFGTQTANYSSVVRGLGFAHVARVAKAMDLKRIVIKPHPYLGLLHPITMWPHFLRGVRMLRDQGFDVRLAVGDMFGPMRSFIQLRLRGIKPYIENVDRPLPVRCALTDVSGMEAVLLVARIPTLVIKVLEHPLPLQLREIMAQKILTKDADVETITRRYVDQAETLDTQHRSQLFGLQDPALAQMTGPERMSWLTRYVQTNGHWNQAQPALSARHIS